MSGINFIPSFSFYNLASSLASPYTSFAAYTSGAIDENGNVISNEASIDPFEYFVIKLKKIFEQLPYGSTRYKLGNVIGVMELFSEEATYFGVKKEEFNCLVEEHFSYISDNEISYFELLEDMAVGGGGGAAGSLGTPAAGGAGVNTGSISGYDPRMGSMMSRNGPVNMIPSIEMFNVNDDEFSQFKQAKAWKHLKDSETKKYLQRFQRRNKTGKMAVRNSNTGELHWINYKEKSLIEELNLFDLNILNESDGAIGDYTDSVNDKETNVSTLTNQQERSQRGAEIGREIQKKSRQMHSAFGSYLKSINLTPHPFPTKEIRDNPEKLAEYHSAMPHGSFYIGENPDEGGGHDSYVKINDDIHGGIELKGSGLNRRGKFEITPINVGGLKNYASTAVRTMARSDQSAAARLQSNIDSFLENKKGAVSSIFSNIPKPKSLGGLIRTRAQREIAKKGEILVIGSQPSGGFHVLTTALKENDPAHIRQTELIKAIGLHGTGKLSDWGSPIRPRWVNRSLKSKFELKIPQSNESEIKTSHREAYEKNKKILGE